jgi:hypothetical protein
LAAKVRAKFPGVYDDLDDAALESAVLAKHPEYADLAKPTADFSNVQKGTSTAAVGSKVDPMVAQAGNLQQMAVGALKGAGNTVFGLGKMVHDYTPIGRISDAIQPGAFDQKPPELEPTNRAQTVGHAAEQMGEFLIPGTAATKVGLVGRAATDAGLALAQSGSPVQAGVTGALSAAIPGASAVGTLARKLETSAQKSMAQALGATKEWAKSEAAKLAPEMLKRGIGGSRPAMLDLAKQTAKRVGGELDAAYSAAAAAGETVPGGIIQGHLQTAADALKVTTAKGTPTVIPGTEAVVQKLDDLHAFVGSLGNDIPVDKAATIKRTWDHIVSKAGLFGPKATASATDSAQAWATREASGSFRELLNTNPTIDALNKETAFWVGLKGVLKETEKRTQAQNSGLIASVMASPGAVAGAVAGGPAGAVLGGLASQQLVKVLQSPAWRTQVSAPMKHFLADALASGSTARVVGATNRILAALPAQVGAQ